MLRNLADKFRFLVAGIPFTKRHVTIRILLHMLFLFLLWVYGESLNSMHDSWWGKLNMAIMIAVYFNIYYFILQYSLPVMLLLLVAEPLCIYVLLVVPPKDLNASIGQLVVLFYASPFLHIAYIELIYILRKELAKNKINENDSALNHE